MLSRHFLNFTARSLFEMSVKRRVLTLKDKLSVVEKRDKRYSYARMAAEFQIGKSTVFDIV